MTGRNINLVKFYKYITKMISFHEVQVWFINFIDKFYICYIFDHGIQ